MQPEGMTKYVYQIRCRNGAIVENLQIYGRDQEDSRRKLNQMYHHCEILDERVAQSERIGITNYEDVLNLITESR